MPRAPPQRKIEDDIKPKKIPRPPNAWILYRTDRLHEWRAARSPNSAPVKQADISRLIASKWKIEPDHVKLEYEKRAAIAKAEHKKKFPDYKYNPVSKEVKDKMRAEEREAKKKAREEAKAAKVAGHKVSHAGIRRNSTSVSPRPTSSNVKLEVFEAEDVKPILVSEPISRGCGPSPPLDYDPECSSTSSGTPFLSSSSSVSVRSSPFPSSSSLPPPTPLDASNAWSHSLTSPMSSSPSQPPPAYPSTFLHSPMPSRHSSYNFITPSLPSQSLVSTPSDSPPSYTEGENWQSQTSTLGFQPFAPVPEFQGDWSEVSTFLQPDISFPLPTMDPLLAGASNFNIGAMGTNSIYDIVANHSAQSPPGELDIASMLHQSNDTNDALVSAQSTDNQLTSMLDMAELHETMEDHANDAGIVLPDQLPFSVEEFAVWVNSHPQATLILADPEFYLNLAAEVTSQFQQNVDPSLQQPPSCLDPAGMPILPEFTSAPFDPETYDMLNIMLRRESEIPVPTTPPTSLADGMTAFPPSLVETEIAPSVAPFTVQHESVTATRAPGPQAHVAWQLRRRVGATHVPPQFQREGGSA